MTSANWSAGPADGKIRMDGIPVKAPSAAFPSPEGAERSFSISQNASALELTLPAKQINKTNSVIKIALESPFPLGWVL